MELRETAGDVNTATSSTIVAQKAVFLLDNGKIVDLDGASEVEFEIAIAEIYLLLCGTEIIWVLFLQFRL
ncbi:MAG: hypothetical protein R2764_16700 [Bacteroidales bacterium]